MDSSTLLDALKEQKKILEQDGYQVAYICIYGSQNYGLDLYTPEYQSDIDMKAIVVPTLDDLVKNSKPVSTVVDTQWGQCDVKDIRTYFETLLKANPAYIETLFTDYYLIDDHFKQEFDQILSLKEELVYTLRAQFIRAIYGMMCEKEKALCHPYPVTAHKIEQFGYDGKQAHHIYRLWLMMLGYFNYDLKFTCCLYPPESERLLLNNLKLNYVYLLKFVQDFVSDTMAKAKKFKDDYLNSVNGDSIDDSIRYKFIDLSQEIIKNKIIDDIKKDGE